MTNKVFTFKYNPEITPEGMFADFWKATKGKLHLVKPDEISSPHLGAILTSINKNQWEIFDLLVKKKPNTLIKLAKLLSKDYDNIVKDAEILVGMGIIKLDQQGSEIKPIALYDRIVFDFGFQEASLKELKLEAEVVINDLLAHQQEGSFHPLVAHGVLTSHDLKSLYYK